MWVGAGKAAATHSEKRHESSAKSGRATERKWKRKPDENGDD